MNKIEKHLRGMWGTINCITVYIEYKKKRGEKKKGFSKLLCVFSLLRSL